MRDGVHRTRNRVASDDGEVVQDERWGVQDEQGGGEIALDIGSRGSAG